MSLPYSINSLDGASRKTVQNIVSTLSAMLTTAKRWGYSAREVELKSLVLPDRNSYVAPHFTRSQIESIFSLAQEPLANIFCPPRDDRNACRRSSWPSVDRY
jgi:hypothetical protein